MRKRFHTATSDVMDVERKRRWQMEREEHEQRMKNLRLEADVFELQRVKLHKQIQLLSNVNALNLAMQ